MAEVEVLSQEREMDRGWAGKVEVVMGHYQSSPAGAQMGEGSMLSLVQVDCVFVCVCMFERDGRNDGVLCVCVPLTCQVSSQACQLVPLHPSLLPYHHALPAAQTTD